MKTLLLATAGLSVVGGIATGTYLFWPESKPKVTKKLQSLLTDHKLLKTNSDENDPQWAELIQKYITLPPEKQSKKITQLTFKGQANAPNPADITTLKSKCNELFEIPVDDNNIDVEKQNAIDWCTETGLTN